MARAFDMENDAELLIGYQRFAVGSTEPPPNQPLLRRVTDRGLDPIAVKMAQRIQKLSQVARHAIETVLMAFEIAEGDSENEK